MYILEGEQYKEKLIQAANDSQLPLNVIYYITKDFFYQIEKIYFEALTHAKNNVQEGSMSLEVSGDGTVRCEQE